MSLAATGAVGPKLAAALVLGANIGSSIAPLMALTGQPAAARRVPLGNLIARTTVAVAGPAVPVAVSGSDGGDIERCWRARC